ncbi:hypothetical protein [Streptomyces wuyuanensis]|uniref:hypothetical protein n=1 Tax=Streptomyces wuyuanensis TaxID=1196353 RepID=UPI003789ADF0
MKTGVGWGRFTAITGRGGLYGDARADLLARDGKGDLWLYRGEAGAASCRAPGPVRAGAPSTPSSRRGDFDHGGRQEVIGRTPTGAAYLCNADDQGGFIASTPITSKHWKRHVHLS